MSHQVQFSIPSVKDVGNTIADVARNGYEGEIHIPSAQQAVDATVGVTKRVFGWLGRIRISVDEPVTPPTQNVLLASAREQVAQ